MAMSKKDFVALANALRPIAQERKDTPSQVMYDRILYALCGFCHKQNPRFMEDRFKDYLDGVCGPNGAPKRYTK